MPVGRTVGSPVFLLDDDFTPFPPCDFGTGEGVGVNFLRGAGLGGVTLVVRSLLPCVLRGGLPLGEVNLGDLLGVTSWLMESGDDSDDGVLDAGFVFGLFF